MTAVKYNPLRAVASSSPTLTAKGVGTLEGHIHWEVPHKDAPVLPRPSPGRLSDPLRHTLQVYRTSEQQQLQERGRTHYMCGLASKQH